MKFKSKNYFSLILCLFLTICLFFLSNQIISFKKVYGDSIKEEDALNIYDEINFINEFNYQNRDLVIDDINRVYELCNEFSNKYNVNVTDLPLDISNYFKLVQMRDKIDYYNEVDSTGLLVEISAPKEISIGEEYLLKINVTNTKETALPEISYNVEYRKTTLMPIGDTKGNFVLQSKDQQELEIKFKALEGSYQIIKIYFNNGNLSYRTIESSLYICPPGYYFADFHTHSNRSDGAPSMAENLRYAINHGLNIMCATDHNSYVENLQDLNQAKKAVDECMSEKYLYLKGCEFTDYNGGKGHALHLNPVKHYPTPDTIEGYSNVIDKVIGNGSIFFMAHPFAIGSNSFKPLDPNDVEKSIDKFLKIFKKQTGYEIMDWYQNDDTTNSDSTYSGMTVPALELWDKSNILGEKKYFGTADSDAHWVNCLGVNRNGVYLEDFTEINYLNSIVTGRFYLTNGPELRFNIENKSNGESVIISSGKKVNSNIRVYATTSPITKVSLIKYSFNKDYNLEYSEKEIQVLFDDPNAEMDQQELIWQNKLDVKPNEFYRVEVLAKGTENLVRQAYSQPIWITTPSTSITVEEKQLSLKAGETSKINFSSDNLFDSISLKSSNTNVIEVLDNGFIKINQNAQSGQYNISLKSESGVENNVILNIEGEKQDNISSGCKNSLFFDSINCIEYFLVGVIVLCNLLFKKYQKR